jgi:hypothetical protein
VTLNQMNDKLNTLTARVITAETDIVHVKSRVADLEASSQGPCEYQVIFHSSALHVN